MEKLSLVFKNLQLWLVLILLAFIPLYPKLPILNVAGTFVAVRLEDFLIALTFIVWGFSILLGGRLKKLLNDKLIQTLLIFFFIGLVSLFSAIFITQTVKLNLGGLHFLRRLELMLLLPLIIDTIHTKKQFKIAAGILIAVLVVVNLYALGQQYLGFKVISTTNSEFSKGQILTLSPNGRVNSTFAGHYDLAVFMMMCLAILTPFLFLVKNRSKLTSIQLITKLSLLVLLGVSFFVLVLTAARLSFAAAGVGIAMALWLSGKRILILALIVLAAAALIYPSQLRDRFVSTVVVNLGGGGQRYEATDSELRRNVLNLPTIDQRVSTSSTQEATSTVKKVTFDIAPGEPVDSTQLGVYRSIQIRLNVEWPKAINAFLKNPLLGTGYSSLGVASDNDYLRSLGEIGLLGTIAFMLIMIVIIKDIRSIFRSQNRFLKMLGAGMLSMIAAFLINALVIDVFEASKVASMFWILIGITIAARKVYQP